MLIRAFRHHPWIGKVGRTVQAFQAPALSAAVSTLSGMVGTVRSLFFRINWRSPILLGFALSLIYWIGLFGWMVAEVDFKAFRYAGF